MTPFIHADYSMFILSRQPVSLNVKNTVFVSSPGPVFAREMVLSTINRADIVYRLEQECQSKQTQVTPVTVQDVLRATVKVVFVLRQTPDPVTPFETPSVPVPFYVLRTPPRTPGPSVDSRSRREGPPS